MNAISVREWGYLKIGADPGNPTSISQTQAEALMKAAGTAARGLWSDRDLAGRVLSHEHRRLRAQQAVGVLSTKPATLEILPKIDDQGESAARETLIRMLARVIGLPISEGALTRLGVQRYNLLEILIRLFCDRLFASLHRGLPRSYLEHSRDLTLVRGRINLARQFTTLLVEPQKVACIYDDLSADIPINQIVKAAISTLMRVSRRTENQRRLHELDLAYSEISRVPLDRLPWDRVVLDRTNAGWHEVLKLAKLLLDRDYQTTNLGSADGFALVFEMNRLFEEFIGRSLQAACRSQTIRVHLQRMGGYALTDAAGRRRFVTIPDIALLNESGAYETIIDTKWKRLKSGSENAQYGVSQSDVYQMMAYSQIYGCKRLILLYPHHGGIGLQPGCITEFQVTGSDAVLQLATVDLSQFSQIPAQLKSIMATSSGSTPLHQN